jgi:hypothetical protein
MSHSSSQSASVAPASWSDSLKKVFVECMKEQTMRGNFTDTGFKSSSWKQITADFNSRSGMSTKFNVSQLQSQYSFLKKKYTSYLSETNKSKWLWMGSRHSNYSS